MFWPFLERKEPASKQEINANELQAIILELKAEIAKKDKQLDKQGEELSAKVSQLTMAQQKLVDTTELLDKERADSEDKTKQLESWIQYRERTCKNVSDLKRDNDELQKEVRIWKTESKRNLSHANEERGARISTEKEYQSATERHRHSTRNLEIQIQNTTKLLEQTQYEKDLLNEKIQSLHRAVSLAHSRERFHDEKDDGYFEQAFSELERNIRNWVKANFDGLEDLSMCSLEGSEYFTMPQGTTKKVEALIRIRHYVADVITINVFQHPFAAMATTEDFAYSFEDLEFYMPDGRERCQWRARTLHALSQGKFLRDRTEQSKQRVVTLLENELGPYSTAGPVKSETRQRTLSKIIHQAFELWTETMLLSSSDITVSFPDLGDPYDSNEMTCSGGNTNIGGDSGMVCGMLFPAVYKTSYDRDGTSSEGVMKKANVLVEWDEVS